MGWFKRKPTAPATPPRPVNVFDGLTFPLPDDPRWITDYCILYRWVIYEIDDLSVWKSESGTYDVQMRVDFRVVHFGTKEERKGYFDAVHEVMQQRETQKQSTTEVRARAAVAKLSD